MRYSAIPFLTQCQAFYDRIVLSHVGGLCTTRRPFMLHDSQLFEFLLHILVVKRQSKLKLSALQRFQTFTTTDASLNAQ